MITLVQSLDRTNGKFTHCHVNGFSKTKLSQIIPNRLISEAKISNKIHFFNMFQLINGSCSQNCEKFHFSLSTNLLKWILMIGMFPYMQWDFVGTVGLSSKYWRIIIKITITSLEWEKSLAIGFLMQIRDRKSVV